MIITPPIIFLNETMKENTDRLFLYKKKYSFLQKEYYNKFEGSRSINLKSTTFFTQKKKKKVSTAFLLKYYFYLYIYIYLEEKIFTWSTSV